MSKRNRTKLHKLTNTSKHNAKVQLRGISFFDVMQKWRPPIQTQSPTTHRQQQENGARNHIMSRYRATLNQRGNQNTLPQQIPKTTTSVFKNYKQDEFLINIEYPNNTQYHPNLDRDAKLLNYRELLLTRKTPRKWHTSINSGPSVEHQAIRKDPKTRNCLEWSPEVGEDENRTGTSGIWVIELRVMKNRGKSGSGMFTRESSDLKS